MDKSLENENNQKLFDLVSGNDLAGLTDLFTKLDEAHQVKKDLTDEKMRKRLGHFANFLDFPDFNLNKKYSNKKTLVMMACDNSNLDTIRLLVKDGAVL